MGMLTAMYSGVNGLNVHGRALSSVADNVANVSTHAYKATRTNFGDIMVHSLTVGGTVVEQVGTGAHVINVQNLMTQGSFETTDIPTDLAINGAGFFKVVDTSTVNSTSQGAYYTRAGQFTLDDQGYLVNPSGYRLQGYNTDSSFTLQQTEEDLQILTQQTQAVSTTKADFSINLDAEDTDSYHPSRPVDPDDQSTWNYMTSIRVYDSLGVPHDMAVIFQRLDSYGGSTDPDSNTATVWKAEVFENNDSTLTATPSEPDNIFYLQFDTDGKLVGTSTGDTAYGDMYTSTATVSAESDAISGRLGEVLTFTPDGGSAETYTSTVDITCSDDLDEIVSIGSDTYDLSTLAGPTAADVAEQLAQDINSNGGGYWATFSGSKVTVYADGSTPLNVQITNDGDSDMSTTFDSLSDVRSGINGGLGATGAIDFSGANVNDEVSVNGVTYTYSLAYGGLGSDTFTDASELAAELLNDNAGMTFTDVNSDSVFIKWTSGSTGNAIALDDDPSGTNTGTMVISDTTLNGGMDGTATSNVQAPSTQVGSSYALRLDNTTTGTTTGGITIGSSNTLGESIGFSFDSGTSYWTQNEWETDAVGGTFRSVDDYGYETIQFDFDNATPDQDIDFYFAPTDGSASTQSAGASETFYLYQDGSPRGYLTSMDIASDGTITGQFSNGTLRTLGAVVLVDFASETELERVGENLWAQTINSGEPVTNRAGQGGLGTIESGALEQSNVDLATEFVKMINYQRAFQANSRTISTTDDMLAELINLKR